MCCNDEWADGVMMSGRVLGMWVGDYVVMMSGRVTLLVLLQSVMMLLLPRFLTF